MKRIGLAFALALLASPVAAQDVIAGKITRVIDGDTFVVRAGNRDVHIRLWAVDAPELANWPWGPRAKFTMESLVNMLGPNMRCETKGKSHDRIVAQCFSEKGGDLGAWMIRSGTAVEYERFGKGVYSEAESIARKNRHGIWHDFRSPALPD